MIIYSRLVKPVRLQDWIYLALSPFSTRLACVTDKVGGSTDSDRDCEQSNLDKTVQIKKGFTGGKHNLMTDKKRKED